MSKLDLETVDNTKLAEIAENAADLVRNGWVQWSTHLYNDGTDLYCAAGAITKATHNMFPGQSVEKLEIQGRLNFQLFRVINANTREPVVVEAWNDHPERTKEDVVQALLQVADNLRSSNDYRK